MVVGQRFSAAALPIPGLRLPRIAKVRFFSNVTIVNNIITTVVNTITTNVTTVVAQPSFAYAYNRIATATSLLQATGSLDAVGLSIRNKYGQQRLFARKRLINLSGLGATNHSSIDDLSLVPVQPTSPSNPEERTQFPLFKGNNQLNALGIFTQRTLYAKEILNDSGIIDLWKNKYHYGRINYNGQAVHPSQAYFKQLLSNKPQPAFVLNFAADAFNDMFKLFEQAKTYGRLSVVQDSLLSDISPVVAWSDVNQLYHAHIKLMYDVFIGQYPLATSKGINKEQTFLQFFLRFLMDIVGEFPISKTAFLLSKFSPPEVTGLVIDLANLSYDKDSDKIDSYINDFNFDFFKSSAQQFGFMIDKNAPWRLVADLKSPAMTKYLAQNALTTENVFDTLYHRVITEELAVLKLYTTAFYNSWIGTGVLDVSGQTQNKTLSSTDDNYWLRLYLWIRAKETKTRSTQTDFENLVSTVFSLKKTLKADIFETYLESLFPLML